MVEYANWYGLDMDVAEAFVDIMRALDNTYVEYHSAEQKRKADLQSPPKPQRT